MSAVALSAALATAMWAAPGFAQTTNGTNGTMAPCGTANASTAGTTPTTGSSSTTTVGSTAGTASGTAAGAGEQTGEMNGAGSTASPVSGTPENTAHVLPCPKPNSTTTNDNGSMSNGTTTMPSTNGTTMPSTNGTTTTPSGSMQRGTMQNQNTGTSTEDMNQERMHNTLRDNPNGSSWYAKFNRPAAIAKNKHNSTYMGSSTNNSSQPPQ